MVDLTDGVFEAGAGACPFVGGDGCVSGGVRGVSGCGCASAGGDAGGVVAECGDEPWEIGEEISEALVGSGGDGCELGWSDGSGHS
jgi:hypothetical protein